MMVFISDLNVILFCACTQIQHVTIGASTDKNEWMNAVGALIMFAAGSANTDQSLKKHVCQNDNEWFIQGFNMWLIPKKKRGHDENPKSVKNDQSAHLIITSALTDVWPGQRVFSCCLKRVNNNKQCRLTQGLLTNLLFWFHSLKALKVKWGYNVSFRWCKFILLFSKTLSTVRSQLLMQDFMTCRKLDKLLFVCQNLMKYWSSGLNGLMV